jgi:hypothetical protein
MTSNVETKHCDTLDEFWDCISPIGDFFNRPGPPLNFVYRGQSNSEWELIPRVFRQDVIDKYKQGMLSTLKDHPGQAIFEYVLLAKFVDYCDSKGLAIPNDSPEFRRYFKWSTITMVHGSFSDGWPHDQAIPLMALAQHHGVPTRLLDWSNNPYVASYFAAVSAITDSDFKEEDRIAVFGLCLNRIPEYGDRASPFYGAGMLQRVRVPGSTSVNLASQGGSFILVYNHGRIGSAFTPDVSLESMISGDNKPLLKKVTLPKGLAGELLIRCGKFGVSAASLFPGYDGAARSVLESIQAENFQKSS